MKNVNLFVAVRPYGQCSNVSDEIRREFESSPLDSHDPDDWPGLLSHLSSAQPEVLLLELEPFIGRLEDVLREIRNGSPRTKVVIVHPDLDSQTILRSIRAGADEFVHPPWDESLHIALRRLAAAIDSGPGHQHRGKVIAFLSAKGGCGATTIACHIANLLHRQTGKSVLLADFDFTSGMIGFLMKANSMYSILDAAENLSRLDNSLWKALIAEVKPGFSVVPSPASFDYSKSPDKEDLCATIRFMRTQHDWVVLDLGRSLNSVASSVYEEVDQIFLVSVLEVIALHGLKTIVRGLIESGHNLDKLQLILNRAPKMMDMTTGELEKILGRSLYAIVPNDYASLNQAYSQGTLVSEANRLTQQFSSLAGKIAGVQQAKQKKKFALFG
jgi:pilus assembly protein CpaE